MQLVNATSVPAQVTVGNPLGSDTRMGIVTAKATFCLTERAPELDSQSPLSLLPVDEQTELGLLPRDDLLRRDRRFEVMLLGKAYAPSDEPVGRRDVTLRIGDETRKLAVFGDREWRSGAMTEPEPFTSMPLTLERTFGGYRRVEVDEGAFMLVTDPLNPFGRGFDPAPMTAGLGEALACPSGYPKYDEARALPNLEDPDDLIDTPSDRPEPMFWGALPMECPFHSLRGDSKHARASKNASAAKKPRIENGVPVDVPDAPLVRAHPTWVIDLPGRGAEVSAEGVRPAGQAFSFALPSVRVWFDYVTGERSGSRELRPHSLVLLPEELRFYIVFRHSFLYRYGGERSMRMRVEREGWFEERG